MGRAQRGSRPRLLLYWTAADRPTALARSEHRRSSRPVLRWRTGEKRYRRTDWRDPSAPGSPAWPAASPDPLDDRGHCAAVLLVSGPRIGIALSAAGPGPGLLICSSPSPPAGNDCPGGSGETRPLTPVHAVRHRGGDGAGAACRGAADGSSAVSLLVETRVRRADGPVTVG